MKTAIRSIVLMLLPALPAAAQPQEEPVPIAFRRQVRSAVLDEDRAVIVALPDLYERSAKSYPVLFLLDGEAQPTTRAAGLVRYLSGSRWPEMIVVGIPNVDRARDLSVVPLEQLPTSTPEGPARFLRFLTAELVPFIDANYRTTRYRILYGASAAGQYAVYAMLNAPEAFDAFLTGGAALGIGGTVLLDQAEAFFARQKTFSKFLSLVSFENDLLVATEYAPQFVRIFERYRVPGFRRHVETVPGAGHVPPTSLLDGLSALFADWQPVAAPVLSPSGGRVPPGSEVRVEIGGRVDDVRCTVDGAEPDRRSRPCPVPVVVSGPATIKARTFRGELSESATATAEFVAEPLQPAIAAAGLAPGLAYRYFERPWFELPDRIDREPEATGVVSTVGLQTRRRASGFVFEFGGFIEVPTDGVYTFSIEANAASKVFIDGTLLLTARNSVRTVEESRAIGLKAGLHALRILHANAWYAGPTLRFSYAGPGIGKREVPADVLFHEGDRK